MTREKYYPPTFLFHHSAGPVRLPWPRNNTLFPLRYPFHTCDVPQSRWQPSTQRRSEKRKIKFFSGKFVSPLWNREPRVFLKNLKGFRVVRIFRELEPPSYLQIYFGLYNNMFWLQATDAIKRKTKKKMI